MIIQLGLTGPLLQVTKTVAGEVGAFFFVGQDQLTLMECNAGSAASDGEVERSTCPARGGATRAVRELLSAEYLL